MRVAAGILMIIVAVICAVIGFGTLFSEPVLLAFFMALPALLILLVAFLLGFGGYRVLKRKK